MKRQSRNFLCNLSGHVTFMLYGHHVLPKHIPVVVRKLLSFVS